MRLQRVVLCGGAMLLMSATSASADGPDVLTSLELDGITVLQFVPDQLVQLRITLNSMTDEPDETIDEMIVQERENARLPEAADSEAEAATLSAGSESGWTGWPTSYASRVEPAPAGTATADPGATGWRTSTAASRVDPAPAATTTADTGWTGWRAPAASRAEPALGAADPGSTGWRASTAASLIAPAESASILRPPSRSGKAPRQAVVAAQVDKPSPGNRPTVAAQANLASSPGTLLQMRSEVGRILRNPGNQGFMARP